VSGPFFSDCPSAFYCSSVSCSLHWPLSCLPSLSLCRQLMWLIFHSLFYLGYILKFDSQPRDISSVRRLYVFIFHFRNLKTLFCIKISSVIFFCYFGAHDKGFLVPMSSAPTPHRLSGISVPHSASSSVGRHRGLHQSLPLSQGWMV